MSACLGVAHPRVVDSPLPFAWVRRSFAHMWAPLVLGLMLRAAVSVSRSQPCLPPGTQRLGGKENSAGRSRGQEGHATEQQCVLILRSLGPSSLLGIFSLPLLLSGLSSSGWGGTHTPLYPPLPLLTESHESSPLEETKGTLSVPGCHLFHPDLALPLGIRQSSWALL